MNQQNNLENNKSPDETKAEHERTSMDTIRVHNPTREDYQVKWDLSRCGKAWIIPAGVRDIGYGRSYRCRCCLF